MNLKTITFIGLIISVLLISGCSKEKAKVENSIKVQDNIRAKIKGWDSVKEIRKWREKKAS